MSVHLDRFVGERSTPRFAQGISHRGFGGQVEIREESVLRTKESELARLRFLHVEKQSRRGEHRRGIRRDLGAGRTVLVVSKARPESGVGLDDDTMTPFGQCADG